MTAKAIFSSIESEITQIAKIVNKRVVEILSKESDKLLEPMLYSILDGKCLRPFLLIETAKIFGLEMEDVLDIAVAIEMLHSYSLIHDDLPAMDNDDIRRGKITCHKAFGEATAILAGDALHTYAFEILSERASNKDPEIRCLIINAIAKAIGISGMAGGQMLDLSFENKEVLELEIINMQLMKTAYLFSVSSEIACIVAKTNLQTQNAIKNYSLNLGLTYQIVDDILDEIGAEEILGKVLCKDKKAGKATLVTKYGVEYANNKAYEYNMIAKKTLDEIVDFDVSKLKEIADFIFNRTY